MGVLTGCKPRAEVLKGDLEDEIFAAHFGDLIAGKAPSGDRQAASWPCRSRIDAYERDLRARLPFVRRSKQRSKCCDLGGLMSRFVRHREKWIAG